MLKVKKSLYSRIPPHTFHPSSRLSCHMVKEAIDVNISTTIWPFQVIFKKRLQLSIKEEGKEENSAREYKRRHKNGIPKNRVGPQLLFPHFGSSQPFKLWPAAPLNLLQSACQSNTVCIRFKVTKIATSNVGNVDRYRKLNRTLSKN